MDSIIEWFIKNYPKQVEKLKNCTHEQIGDINPYHLESDCWSHTMMVCKVAQILNAPKIVKIASLLHDIAKPDTRGVNPKNNFVNFFGHEPYSAFKSLNILKKMQNNNIVDDEDIAKIFTIISLHTLPYKVDSSDILIEKFKYDLQLLKDLIILSKSDSMGRFASSFAKHNPKIYDETLQKLSEIKPISYQQGNKPTVEFVVSIDKKLQEEYISKFDNLFIASEFGTDYLDALKEGRNIIINHKAITKRDRNIFLESIPSYYTKKATVLIAPVQDAIKENRKNLRYFEYPLYDEVDRVENIISKEI